MALVGLESSFAVHAVKKLWVRDALYTRVGLESPLLDRPDYGEQMIGFISTAFGLYAVWDWNRIFFCARHPMSPDQCLGRGLRWQNMTSRYFLQGENADIQSTLPSVVDHVSQFQLSQSYGRDRLLESAQFDSVTISCATAWQWTLAIFFVAFSLLKCKTLLINRRMKNLPRVKVDQP